MSMFGFKIWKVSDNSMAPSIPKNSYVLVNHWFNLHWTRLESLVLIQHHFYGIILKKIALIDRNGFIWSRSEHHDSLPIEQFGPVNAKQIIGHVLFVFKQKAHDQ
ncbi:MAG: nickel-type superoxide dismutase maturation protease [Thalassotalea sp.]